MNEFWLAIGAASIVSSAVGAAVAMFVRDRRLDDAVHAIEANRSSDLRNHATWDNQIQARVADLESEAKDFRSFRSHTRRSLTIIADGVKGIQQTQEAISDQLIPFVPAGAATDDDGGIILRLTGNAGGEGA